MVFCSFALSEFRRLKIGVAGKSLRAKKVFDLMTTVFLLITVFSPLLLLGMEHKNISCIARLLDAKQ
jgi:hypothetical protein